jgi:hypothetical protein
VRERALERGRAPRDGARELDDAKRRQEFQQRLGIRKPFRKLPERNYASSNSIRKLVSSSSIAFAFAPGPCSLSLKCLHRRQ